MKLTTSLHGSRFTIGASRLCVLSAALCAWTCSCSPARAQVRMPPVWDAWYNGPGGSKDRAYAVAVDADGNVPSAIEASHPELIALRIVFNGRKIIGSVLGVVFAPRVPEASSVRSRGHRDRGESNAAFPYQTNAGRIFITEPSPSGNRFYRLRKGVVE